MTEGSAVGAVSAARGPGRDLDRLPSNGAGSRRLIAALTTASPRCVRPSPQSRSARQLPLSPRGALGAAVQTAFSNYHTFHERPLRGTDAQCAPLRYKSRDCAKKLLCAASIPCSGAVGAALGKSSEAVMAIRFHWPARSREGAGSTGRDSPMERNGLGIASSGDARRAAQSESGGRSPRRVLGTFPR